MKMNEPLKRTYEKEYGKLKFDLIFTILFIFAFVYALPLYCAILKKEGYSEIMIEVGAIWCFISAIVFIIVTLIKMSTTKKLCVQLQKNIDDYAPSGKTRDSLGESLGKSIKILFLSVTRKWRAERRKAEADRKVSEMLRDQMPELVQTNVVLGDENKKKSEEIRIKNEELRLSMKEKESLKFEVENLNKKMSVVMASVESLPDGRLGRRKEELMELFTVSDEKAERIIDFLIRVQKEDKSLSRDYAKRLMQYYIELCSLGILHDNMSAFATYFFPSSGKSSEESYRKALTNARIKLQNADDESRETVRRQIMVLVK